MTTYETVRRVPLDYSVTFEIAEWGPDTVSVSVINMYTAWQGTDRESLHYERIDTDGMTVAELEAFAEALAAAVADVKGKGKK